jgi:hypothetical protein
VAGSVWNIYAAHDMRGVALERVRKQQRLVLALAARQSRIVHRHFLEAADIRIAELARNAHDARRIDDAIHAAAPLDVPLQEAHGHWRP